MPFKSNSQASDDNISVAYEIFFTERDNFDIKTIKEKDGDIPYSIYSYGGDVNIKINGKVISLKNAIDEKKITIEEILNKSKDDRKKGIIDRDMYRDGGSQKYQYPNYTIESIS